jgi:cold shock protein
MSEIGFVKSYAEDRGYGMITRESGEDIFVHRSGLARGVKTLLAGDMVKFDCFTDVRGTQARNVTLFEG